MTFKEFQMTAKYCDLGKALADECLHQGNLYLSELFVEDTRTWIPSNSEVGRWYTIIGREEYDSDDLEEIERILYQFAIDEGYEATLISTLECALCDEPIEDQAESTPLGSMHAECAIQHESQNPDQW